MSTHLVAALVADTAIGIAVLASPSWVRYCVGGVACSSMHTTGVLFVTSFCMHEPRCMDALQFGVFMMLCIAMLCRAWFLYVAGVALYDSYHPEQHQAPPFRLVNGLIVMLQLLTTAVAQYTFVLVIFLKLNGDQHASFSNVLWPFYLSWCSIVVISAIFYFQPTTTDTKSLPVYSPRPRAALPTSPAAPVVPRPPHPAAPVVPRPPHPAAHAMPRPPHPAAHAMPRPHHSERSAPAVHHVAPHSHPHVATHHRR